LIVAESAVSSCTTISVICLRIVVSTLDPAAQATSNQMCQEQDTLAR